MIPRIEQKVELKKSNYLLAINWLSKNNFSILYPQRLVASVYFDNDSNEMYFHAREGIIPRKKIRIRTYNDTNFSNLKNNFILEKKITLENKRLKSVKKLSLIEQYFKEGLFDEDYNYCFPKILITYYREYFKYKNFRITIDRNIRYFDYSNGFSEISISEESYVLEIKTSIKENLNFLSNFFDFPRTKFSKYERGMDALREEYHK
tara:strand:- start:701 stop:1318 length:618 start_codon:yes stop_codon:yes gene_type:complete